VELARHWEGDGGVPVVCLPSFSTDRAVTAAAFDPALSAAGGLRRCFVDLPGHGESPAGPETSDGVVAVVSEFLDRELPGQRYLLAGWSYGGYLAMALARRRADVAGLLLVCPGVTIRTADRDVPGAAAGDEPGWLDDVPPRLREHLDAALGNRTRAMAGQVAAVLTGSAPGDEAYRERLRADGYRLSDEDSGLVLTGRWPLPPGARTESWATPTSSGGCPATRPGPSRRWTGPTTTSRSSSRAPSPCWPATGGAAASRAEGSSPSSGTSRR
jgi:pimeloyl-ACP methyl ester carboxylesterase